MSMVSRTFPRARRAVRCWSCNRLIDKGERYHRWVGRGDLWIGLATAKQCAGCAERYGHPVAAAGQGENDGGA